MMKKFLHYYKSYLRFSSDNFYSIVTVFLARGCDNDLPERPTATTRYEMVQDGEPTTKRSNITFANPDGLKR